MLQIGFCGECESPLYANVSPPSANRIYRYYRCSKRYATGECTLRSIPADWLEAESARKFLELFGEHESGHWEIKPAQDYAEELAEVEERIAELDFEFRERELNPSAYTRQINFYETRKAYLESLPVEPEKRTWVGTGETYADRWAKLSDAERVKEWRDTGFTFYVVPNLDGDGFELKGVGSRWPEGLRGPDSETSA